MKTCKKVFYRDLNIGDTFWVWGDNFINYDYPKFCECIKDSDDSAHELDGINFMISPNDEVFEKKIINI